MSAKDYNKQVARRQRIRRTTLVVGVDIGNTTKTVEFMNQEGKVLGSYPKMSTSREGFELFVRIKEDPSSRQQKSVIRHPRYSKSQT